MNRVRVVSCLLLLCGLQAGCSGLPVVRREAPRSPGASASHAPLGGADTATPPFDSRATASLVAEAELAKAQGDLERASAILERAIRVEPSDPLPWSRLAELRLNQNRWQLAEQLAARSNRLAHEAPSLRARNWRVIAACRRQSGDSDGALKAEREANRLTARAR